MVFEETLALLVSDSAMWMPQFVRHGVLSLGALLIAVLIAIPTGIYLTRNEHLTFAVVNFANLGRTIPSLAILALVYPFVGTGIAPSIIALVALAIPPILLATWTAIRSLDEDVLDAADGMGYTNLQRLFTVELPMAAPLIVSSLRTTGVQVVASATLAALIGGGGLGELILSGMSTLQYHMMIAGSVLVAVQAAVIELGFALYLKKGLPEGIRRLIDTSEGHGLDYQAGTALNRRQWRTTLAGVAAGSVALVVAAGFVTDFLTAPSAHANIDPNKPRIVIGSKNFTEQLILGELYAQALEHKGFPVDRRLNLGATGVADAALDNDQIDLYPEYTGTSLLVVFNEKLEAGPDAKSAGMSVYDRVVMAYSKRGLAALDKTPFSNGNTLVTTQAVAQKYDLETMSDLARVSKELSLGAIPGFDTRDDQLPLLAKKYGMQFKDLKIYDSGIKYKSLIDGKVDIAYGFETDGQIARYDLVTLKDDLEVWPPYHVAPIIRQDTLDDGGDELRDTLNAVTALLDATTMQTLNSLVDEDKEDPEDVAAEFLVDQGIAIQN